MMQREMIMNRTFLFSGACANSSSPIIGTPLHVACADNIPNRYEFNSFMVGDVIQADCSIVSCCRMAILTILLTKGADPNKVIESEGTTLRPVLAEYIASNSEPSPQIVHMLLKFGAKVSQYVCFKYK